MADVKRFIRRLLLRWYRLWGRAIVPHRGCMIEIDPHDYFIGSELIVDRTWEKEVINGIERLDLEGRVAIDIGAHVGIHTLVLARTVGENGRVLAIEPDVDHFAMLQRNLERNGASNVDAVRVAAGAEYGSGWLQRHDANLGGHRLVDHETEHPVEIIPVDSLAEPEGVGFVKIDAEGAEAEVLAGMRTIIRRAPMLTLMIEVELDKRDRAEQTVSNLLSEGFHAAAYIGRFVRLRHPCSIRDIQAMDRTNVFFSRNEAFIESLVLVPPARG